MVTQIELLESPDLSPLYFCLWDWIKSEVSKIKADNPDELVARILDAAACINKGEEQLRPTTHDLRTSVAKCTDVHCGDFGTFTVKCNKFVTSGNIWLLNIKIK